MLKSKTRKPATLEDLLAVSAKESRVTRLRRSATKNPLLTLLLAAAVTAWLVLAVGVPWIPAVVLVVAALVLFLGWPLFAFTWRLRVELGIAATLIALWWVLPTWAAVSVCAAATIAFIAIPLLRNFATRLFWWLVTQHRLRGELERIAKGKKATRTPWLMWTKATPVGENVALWLPSGMEAAHIENDLKRLAVACWAKEVRVRKHAKCAHVVYVDVIRRDELSKPVESQILSDINGRLEGAELNSADAYVNEFLSNIEVSAVEARQEPPKQRGQRAKKEAESGDNFADDPF